MPPRHRHAKPALILLGGLACGPLLPVSLAEPLPGRLFFTPEERAAADRARAERASAPAAQSRRVRITGVVKGPGDRATVWVDGAPRRQNGVPGLPPGEVMVQQPGTDGERLKVGGHRGLVVAPADPTTAPASRP